MMVVLDEIRVKDEVAGDPGAFFRAVPFPIDQELASGMGVQIVMHGVSRTTVNKLRRAGMLGSRE